jgi:hypothetical protein
VHIKVTAKEHPQGNVVYLNIIAISSRSNVAVVIVAAVVVVVIVK